MEEKPEYETGPTTAGRPGFVRVLDTGTGRLLFLFDPERDVIEIKPKGGLPVLIDLRYYRWATGIERYLSDSLND